MVTEVGRQPWTITGILKTADAVTPMPGIVLPMLFFTLLYVGLGGIVIALMSAMVRETRATNITEPTPPSLGSGDRPTVRPA